jgi:hypothetical protein
VRFVFTIKFLRSVSDVVIGPLYIPIVAVFAMQLPCASDTPDCWSGASASLHVGTAVIASFVGLLYIALSVTLVGTYYSRDPLSPTPLSRPTSRVMMAQLFVKTVLTVTFILLKSFDSARWLLLVLLLIGTCGLAYQYTMQVRRSVFCSLLLFLVSIRNSFPYFSAFFSISLCAAAVLSTRVQLDACVLVLGAELGVGVPHDYRVFGRR